MTSARSWFDTSWFQSFTPEFLGLPLKTVLSNVFLNLGGNRTRATQLYKVEEENSRGARSMSYGSRRPDSLPTEFLSMWLAHGGHSVHVHIRMCGES